MRLTLCRTHVVHTQFPCSTYRTTKRILRKDINMEKYSESANQRIHGKTLGKPQEDPRKTPEQPRKNLGRPRKNLGRTLGGLKDNLGQPRAALRRNFCGFIFLFFGKVLMPWRGALGRVKAQFFRRFGRVIMVSVGKGDTITT